MSVRLIGAGAVVLATMGVTAVSASAAAPPPDLRVLTTTQTDALNRGSLRVRVAVRAPARVDLTARVADFVRLPFPSARRAGAAAIPPVTVASRRVDFNMRGQRVVALRLTAAGRRAFERCGDRALSVAGESSARPSGRGSPRRRPGPDGRGRPRRRVPAFTGANRSRFVETTLRGDRDGCYRVGVASRSINPGADGRFAGQPVYLGGYGAGNSPLIPGRAATGILGEGIHVRAIAVSGGEGATAIADIETQGWFTATKDGPLGIVDMRKAVEQRTGGRLPAQSVVIQSDHSHSGPDTIGVWGGVPIEYRRFIFDRTVEAIVEAFDTQRAGTLQYGTADGADLLSNQFSYDEANRVVDSDVRVLRAVDGDRRPFATLLNFSAHTTVLGARNTKVSGDWVQAANTLLEERFGGEALTVVGTLGRTQPADRGCPDDMGPGGDRDNSFTEADRKSLCSIGAYAKRVVDRAEQAVAAAQSVPGNPVVAARSFLIQDAGTNAVILGGNIGAPATGVDINRALTPPWLTGNVVGTVTATIRIGDVLLSTLPGEAYPQIPLRVKELVPARGYMTAGLANDQLGYLIAPYESYPEPIRRSFFNQRGDEVNPISNDNFFFNVSPTIGERVTCSLLRGAGEVFGRGLVFREAGGERCVPFANDLLQPAGADTR